MHTTFQLIVAITLTAFVTAAACETLHFIKDRKKEKAAK